MQFYIVVELVIAGECDDCSDTLSDDGCGSSTCNAHFGTSE